MESFAFTPDNQQSLEVPEGHTPRLGWTRFLSLSQPQPGSQCPPVEVNNENYPTVFAPPSRHMLDGIICVTVPTISPFPSIATTANPTTVSPSMQPSHAIVTDEPTVSPTTIRPTAVMTTLNTNDPTTMTPVQTTVPDVSPTSTVTTIRPTASSGGNDDGEELSSNAATATMSSLAYFILYYSFFH